MAQVLVQSKNGVATKAAGSSVALMGVLVAAFCISGLVQGFQPLWVPILFGLMGLFMVALGIDEGFLARVEVTPAAVRIKKWGTWEEHPLDQIEAVDVVRDWLGLGGLILVLAARGRPALQVHLRQYDNRKELAQKLLGVVWQHNPKVLILPRVARRFGQPPYQGR